MAHLAVRTGPRQGARLPLQGDRIILGRESGCDVVIDKTMLGSDADKTESVSRRHAIISLVGGQYFIEDGNGAGPSRNGTCVNDQPVLHPGRVPLRDADRIQLCGFGCTFHETDDDSISVEAAVDSSSGAGSLYDQPAERLRVILEISNSLSTTLDIGSLLPRILDSLFQLFMQVDQGFVILQDEASAALIVQARKTREAEGQAEPGFSATIVRSCLENRQAILGNDLDQKSSQSASLHALHIRSLLCAPLWAQDGRPLGAILLDSRGSKAPFTQDDLNLLVGVASQASIALRNARLHRDSLALQRRERDLEVAQQVQRALLPQRRPDVAGYEFFDHYESAQEIGGDYYDFVPLPGGRLAVLLGDVAGKGVPAALVMARFSVEARVCLESEPDLAAAVARLNAVMVRSAVAERFVTLAATVLDPAAHTATLVSAGHPSPLLCRHAGGQVEKAVPLQTAGPPVGIAEGQVYRSCQLPLLPGDSLVLFSDGVSDALDAQGRPFGTRGIHEVLRQEQSGPHQTGERLLRAVKQHAAGCRQNDDITLVCFGRVGPPRR
jgi:serine phosphatase RsbU (regulator of sigma subunit)